MGSNPENMAGRKFRAEAKEYKPISARSECLRINPDWVQAPPFVPKYKPKPNWADAPEFVPRNTHTLPQAHVPNTPASVLAPPRQLLPQRKQSNVSQAGQEASPAAAQTLTAERSIISPARLVLPLPSTFNQMTGGSSKSNPKDAVVEAADNVVEDLMELSNSWNWNMKVARTGSLLQTPVMVPPSSRRGKLPAKVAQLELCVYAITGECRFGDGCCLVHGDICDLCGLYALHPKSPEQQKAHRKSCLEQHERDMEYSFAMAETADKTCYICYDVIMEKEVPGDQRFGILPGCFHCYCLPCIRSWRKRSRDFESRVGRSCPVCRVPSDFVIPSRVWIDTQDEKDKLISSYKKSMSTKRCQYFDGGAGFCPFGEKCFYLHKVEQAAATSPVSSASTSTSGDCVNDSDENVAAPDEISEERSIGRGRFTIEDRQFQIQAIVTAVLAISRNNQE